MADWAARWRDGRIGFHEGAPNAHLVRHHALIAGARRVLVPLCGKSEDLAWLAAQGHEVVGVEIVGQAAEAFFVEHELAPVYDGDCVRAGGVEIHIADIFATTRDQLGPIDAIWDRAALIALPADIRPRYAAHLRALAPDATLLLVTLAYDQARMDGPPYAVPDAEVHALFAGEAPGAKIEPLASEAAAQLSRPDAPPATERCWRITR